MNVSGTVDYQSVQKKKLTVTITFNIEFNRPKTAAEILGKIQKMTGRGISSQKYTIKLSFPGKI